MYSEWVNNNYIPNPNNIVALTVYSFLTNKPIEELKEIFSAKMAALSRKRSK